MSQITENDVNILENFINKEDDKYLLYDDIQILSKFIFDIWKNTRPRAIWNPVDPKLKDLKEFNEDWVLVAVKMIPEGWYGIPFIAELRDGIWYDHTDQPIEEAYHVKVTHWKTIENYEVGVYNL